MDTIDLNARIVARLPPAELRQSCSDVFHDEIGNIRDQLCEAAEAMARLKDVETAVNRLQEDKSDRRRSTSLMALVADTERVRSELRSRLRMVRLALRSTAGDVDEARRVERSGRLLPLKEETEVSPAIKVERPTDRRRALDVTLEATAADSVLRSERRPDPSDSGGSSSNTSARSSRKSAAEESEDEASSPPVQPAKRRVKKEAVAQPAPVVAIKEEGRTAVNTVESSDNEDSDESDDSASSSDSDAPDPSDWIKELAWEVETPVTAGSEPRRPRATKRKRSEVEQGAAKHTLKSMAALTAQSLDKINASLDSESREQAVEELQRLLAGIMNERSAANPTDKMPDIAAAIDRVSRSIKKAPMSFKEYALVGKTAATLKRLVKSRSTQCAALKRARSDLAKAISVVKHVPALQSDFHPWLSLVLRLDAKAPVDRCRRLEEVTAAFVRALPEYATSREAQVQLASGVRLIILWAKDMPAKGLQSMKSFRQAALKAVADLLTGGYAADVKRMMNVLQHELLEAEARLPPLTEETLQGTPATDSSLQAEHGNPGLRAVELVDKLHGLSGKQRDGRLGELMKWIDAAFQVTSAKEVRREFGRLSPAVKCAVEWTVGRPMARSRVERCRKFVQSVQNFAERVPNEGNRAGLLRKIQPLCLQLSEYS